jgi:hypothetical protein
VPTHEPPVSLTLDMMPDEEDDDEDENDDDGDDDVAEALFVLSVRHSGAM